MSEEIIKLDLREIPVFERHPRIFDAWEDLSAGHTLQITNDHDPKPLRYQFEAEHQNAFSWEYLKKGPDEWVVDIKKLQLAVPEGEELRLQIEEALKEIRPSLQADGGDVELVNIDETERIVTVRLAGACGGCPSAGMTLKAGVEKTVKKYAPSIKSVIAE